MKEYTKLSDTEATLTKTVTVSAEELKARADAIREQIGKIEERVTTERVAQVAYIASIEAPLAELQFELGELELELIELGKIGVAPIET